MNTESGRLKRHGRLIIRLLLFIAFILVIISVISYVTPDTYEVSYNVSRIQPLFHKDVVLTNEGLVVKQELYKFNRVIFKKKESILKRGWVTIGIIREIYVPETLKLHYIIKSNKSCKLNLIVLNEHEYVKFIKNLTYTPLEFKVIECKANGVKGVIESFINENLRNETIYVMLYTLNAVPVRLHVDMYFTYTSTLYDVRENVNVKLLRVFAPISAGILLIASAYLVWAMKRSV